MDELTKEAIERKIEWTLKDAGVQVLDVSVWRAEDNYDGCVGVSRLTFRHLDLLAKTLGTNQIDFAPEADVRHYSTVSGIAVDGRIVVRFRQGRFA